MNVTSLQSHRETKKAEWLAEVDRLLKAHFSIVHTDMGWSPKDVEREFSTGQAPMEVIMKLGHKTDVIWTN